MAATSKVREEMSRMFLDALTKGDMPWYACWQQGRPYNVASGKPYRGVNAAYLSWWSREKGYTDPRWCTYLQAQERGWQVRKGSKSVPVEYWAYYDTKQKKLLQWSEAKRLLAADPDYIQNLRLSCRTTPVFNAEQIDGIPELTGPQTNIDEVRQQRDTLLRNMGVGYREEGGEAYYSPREDRVTLPPEHSFHDVYSYMATFLHECGHATGHSSRLDRDLTGSFGSESYAREELRAEIASTFTGQALGLRMSDSQLQFHMDQHAAYVQHWAAVLQKSPDELFKAIKAAEEISDYLIEKGEFEKALAGPAKEAEPVKEAPTAPAREPEPVPRRGIDVTPPSELLELAKRYPDRSRDHLTEIAAAVRAGLTESQVALIADRRFSAIQAHTIRYAMQEDGLTLKQVRLLADPRYDSLQMDAIRIGFAAGFTNEQIRSYARPELPVREMMARYWEIREQSAPERPPAERPPERGGWDDTEMEM